MALVCHMILQDHVIKGPCNFMGRSTSKSVTILPTWMTIGTLIVGIELLVLRVILYDHVIKESCDFIESRISMKVTIMKSLLATGTVIVEIK